MSQAVPDEVLGPHLQQMGLATQEQLESAVRLQAQSAQGGQPLSLGQALVQIEVLTPVLLENVERKLAAHQAGGLTQLGPYKLAHKLGEGGMGAVYLAEDTQMGRAVAVKVLRPKLAENPEFLSRFKREAIAAGRLNHANIVSAYVFAEEAGVYYYAMEFCDGEPLDKYIKRVRFLPEEEALQLILQVASGLQHAHQHGLIHRDIKPGNIFVTRDGVAKILDLGLSKNVVPGGESFQTLTGVAVGTPHYISPEQARGEKVIDGRTDIYSLGATFYHLVTGETPFHGSTAAAVLVKHLHEQLPNPQDLNPELSDGAVHVIAKMMAKDPADRYANCTELLEDLERVVKGEEPSSAAVDEEHSSVAMRRIRPPAAPRREPLSEGTRETPAGGRRASPAQGAPRPRGATPAAPLGAVEVAARRRPSAAGLTPARRGTSGLYQPVDARRTPAEPARGVEARAEAEEDPQAARDRRRKRIMLYAAGGVVAVILVSVLAWVALSGDEQPGAGSKTAGAPDIRARLEPGLAATYCRGREFRPQDALLSRVDGNVDFNWSQVSPAPSVPRDNFCVRWQGCLAAPKPGCYTLTTVTDDGARLWVDGQLLIDRWTGQSAARWSAEVELAKGLHALRLEFFQGGDKAECRLCWTLPGSSTEQVVAAGALFHDPKVLASMPATSVAAAPPTATAAPPATGPASDPRSELARKLLEQLRKEEAAGTPVAGLRERYEALAQQYGSTAAGREAAERLKDLPVPVPIRILWSCAFDTEAEFKCVSAGEKEEKETCGGTGCAVRSVPNTDAYLTSKLGLSFQGPRGEAVVLGQDSWVRLACRVDGATGIALHSAIGDGLYEKYVWGLPQGQWSWVTFRVSEYTKNIFKNDASKPVPGSVFKGTAIFGCGAGKPCTAYVDSFMIGDGPLPPAPPLKQTTPQLTVNVAESKPETAPATDDPARWAKAINLLPLVDLQRDAVSGTWQLKEGNLASDHARPARIEIPYRPPEEYDFRIAFRRVGGDSVVGQGLSKRGKGLMWCMGGWGGDVSGIDYDGGFNNNPTTVRLGLQNNRRYTSLVCVRNDGIRAFVDGKLVVEWKTDYSKLEMVTTWRMRDGSLLGLLSLSSPTVFESIEVLEVTGKGASTRPGDPAAVEAEKKRSGVAEPAVATTPGPTPAAEGWVVLQPEKTESAGDAMLTLQPDGSVLASGKNPDNDTYTLTATVNLKRIIALRLEVLPDNFLPNKGPGRSANGNFVLTTFSVQADGKPVTLQRASADFEQTSSGPWRIADTLDGDKETGWAVQPELGKAHAAVFEPAAPFDAGTLRIMIEHQSKHKDHNLGRFRLSARAVTTPTATEREVAKVEPATPTAPQPPAVAATAQTEPSKSDAAISPAREQPTERGTILREYWLDLPGKAVRDLTASPRFPDDPTDGEQLAILEGPSATVSNYGTRIRGYIFPPQTGKYVFWIAGDDTAELWLSPTEKPGDKVKIAEVKEWTEPRKWDKNSSQKSAPIPLRVGQKCYIEVLHKQEGGGANLAVGWDLPDGKQERPIPGTRLAPYVPEKKAGTRVPEEKENFLSSMSVQEVIGVDKKLGVGDLGDGKTGISINKVFSPHGLAMYPLANGAARALYLVNKNYRLFTAVVGLNDTSSISPTPVTFRVLGDGRVLWASQPVRNTKVAQNCAVNITGVARLELEVLCPGPNGKVLPVWLEPKVSK